MPRVTPCRLLKGVLLVWLTMVFLWFSLPSPTIDPDDRKMHIQNTLASGRPLITAHDWSKSFNVRDRGEMSSGMALLIRWQLVSPVEGEAVVLKIGDHGSINLRKIIAESKEFNNLNDTAWTPYFSDVFSIDNIWAGDTDHIINLSWFDTTDKYLIHHDMHGFSGGVVLRVVVPEPGMLELWKDAVIQGFITDADYRDLEKGMVPDPYMLRQLYIETWNSLRQVDREFGILATFKGLGMRSLRDVIVEDMKGGLPSTTYPIRKMLLIPLAPVLSIGLFLLYIISGILASLFSLLLNAGVPIGLVYSAIAAAFWTRAGRPEFRTWSAEFWMTRCFYCAGRRKGSKEKHVWGPTGPVSAGRKKVNAWDEEKSVGLQRPQTVRLGRVWKS